MWSYHSNRPGEWIVLEIVSNIWSLSAEGMDRNGILNFPIHRIAAPQGQENIVVMQIDGSVMMREPRGREEIALLRNNCCNVCGIDESLFGQIVQYIDEVMEKVEMMESKDGIDAFLTTIPPEESRRFWSNPNNVQYYKNL